MDYLEKLITALELHAVEEIEECFENGVDPNGYFNNKPFFYELITGYPRGPQFKECVRAFVNHGLLFSDKILLSVLLDDAGTLADQLVDDNDALKKEYTLNGAFTPLYKVSLLHLCAEYNHLACAKVLVQQGADINAKAGLDENGFGGQTPVFHTVNQNANKCMDMLNYLVSQSADLTLTVKGLIWGKGYSWETFIPAVNPISYAMMGLLPQFQRTESQIYEVVVILLKAAYGIAYKPLNIPNKYLGK